MRLYKTQYSFRISGNRGYDSNRVRFYILSALAFLGNRTHDLGVASAMLYQLSYRKVLKNVCDQKSFSVCPLKWAKQIKMYYTDVS